MKPSKNKTKGFSTQQQSNSGSLRPSNSSNMSTRAQRRGSRTTNACEACKKRKTKCTGPPGPCDACSKVDTFCHFNLRLDTRRKVAYKPTAVRERQQYILEGLMQSLKHNDARDVQSLLKLIREEARPHQIAACLRKNIQTLQDRGLLSVMDIDETDLVSLGLQGLYSHRAGRQGPRHSTDKAAGFVYVPDSMQSSCDYLSDTSSNFESHSGVFQSFSCDSPDEITSDTSILMNNNDSFGRSLSRVSSSRPSYRRNGTTLHSSPRAVERTTSTENVSYSGATQGRYSLPRHHQHELQQYEWSFNTRGQPLSSHTPIAVPTPRLDTAISPSPAVFPMTTLLGKPDSNAVDLGYTMPLQNLFPQDRNGRGNVDHESLFREGFHLDAGKLPSSTWQVNAVA